jgi:heme/copper-type cytochrome/quinol oxidase subunit 4
MDARLAPTMKTYLFAWVGMLLLVAVEVLATYAHPAVRTLLATLLVLALLEAAVALLYFMHLKYERRALLWWTVPLVVFALVMLDHVWPDAMRLAAMRLH